MHDDLKGYGRSLEDAFFRKQDEELIAQHTRLEKIRRTRAALSDISGVHNEKVLDKLIELDVSPEILSSIAVVPLVEVAWADGTIADAERDAVLAGAAGLGIKKGSIDHALLKNWLSHRPPKKLLTVWMHYIAGLCETMTTAERTAFKREIIGRAHDVAKAAGGLLGLTMKISPKERDILKKMEQAFA